MQALTSLSSLRATHRRDKHFVGASLAPNSVRPSLVLGGS